MFDTVDRVVALACRVVIARGLRVRVRGCRVHVAAAAFCSAPTTDNTDNRE